MPKETEPKPNLVNFEQLRQTGTRTVEVKVRGLVLRVTEDLEDDDPVEKEIGRARMRALKAGRASQSVLKASGDEPDEGRSAELANLSETMDALDSAVTFDPRRIACLRISRRFVEWNLVGPDGPLSLGFDDLYDGPMTTKMLEEIYDAVRAEPIVGEAREAR